MDVSVGGDTTEDNTRLGAGGDRVIEARTAAQRMNKSYERMDKLLSTNMDMHGRK